MYDRTSIIMTRALAIYSHVTAIPMIDARVKRLTAADRKNYLELAGSL